MSFGFGGSSSSTHGTTTSTTPWTNIANQLANTLKTSLQGIAGGVNVSNWIKTITSAINEQTKQGIASIKSTFAATGMAGSTDLMRNIGNFQAQQSLALGQGIMSAEQTGLSDELASLQDIISLAAGSGTTVGAQHGGNFGWNTAFSLIGH